MQTNTKTLIMSNMIWKYAERIFAQLINLVVSIILARLLLPEDYGLISIVSVFITICNVFVSCGFGNSLIQKENPDELDYSSVLWFSIVFSLFLYFIVFVVSPFLAMYFSNYDSANLVFLIRIMGLRIPIASINSIQHAIISKRMEFKKFFISTSFGTIISAFVGIYLAKTLPSQYGFWALAAQYLTNSIIDTIVLSIVMKWKPILKISFTKLKGLIKYGWKILLSGLLDACYVELWSVVIAKNYSSSELGVYTKGKQFPSLIVNNVDSTIMAVMFPVLSNNQNNIERLKNLTRKSICMSLFLMSPVLFGLAFIAEPTVTILLGEKWLACVPYLQILCIAYSIRPINTSNRQVIKAVGKSGLCLALEIIEKCIGLTLLFIFVKKGVFWIAISFLLVEIICILINTIPNIFILKYTLFEQLIDIIKSIIPTAIMCAIIYFVGYIPLNIYIATLIKIIIGVIVYLIVSIISKNDSLRVLLSILKRNKNNEKNLDDN